MGGGRSSALLLDELFDNGDDRFLAELQGFDGDKKLKTFGERWYHDKRSWARKALLEYVSGGVGRKGHRALVKKVFKLAEAAGDDELMTRFAVAFDRLERRRVAERARWDPATREVITSKRLAPAKGVPRSANEAKWQGTFTRVTRQYMCRRSFRYLRRIGRKDLARYGRLARDALARYADADLATPAQLLDAWSLLHMLYFGSPVLERWPRGIRVKPGRALVDLEPAPYYPEAWKGCFDDVFALASRAESRTVRRFAIEWLRRTYAADLKGLPILRLRPLLESASEDVQTFAASLLEDVSGIDKLPVSTWLELLRLENPFALESISKLVARTVASERLTLAQAVELARAKAGPVAQLGLRWVKEKPIATAEDLALVVRLADAGAPVVRAEAAKWLAELLDAHEAATPAHVREVLDSRHADAREAALGLIARSKRYAGQTLLWAAMAESPYADVQAFLLAHLEAWIEKLERESVLHVWASTLLAVKRGSRAKRTALVQIAERAAKSPSDAEALVPLLAVALRGIRETERKAALASLGAAVVRAPGLREVVAKHVPELVLFPAGLEVSA